MKTGETPKERYSQKGIVGHKSGLAVGFDVVLLETASATALGQKALRRMRIGEV